MRYDIQLGFLAADAITEFSRAAATKDAVRYSTFLDRTAEYCKAVRRTYGQLAEADILDTMPATVASKG